MPANMRKIMGEVPRALEVVAHDDRDQPPVGRKKVSPMTQRSRQEDYLAQVVDGQIPLDADSAEVVKQYLDAHHARQ